mmetsp:Transcript_93202/g.291618  ORF Transcript_93202/g.291618 Transcript_93202/m.291618 type:complete len:500 (+) Transcript_93202:138-1637(+)
MPPPRRCCLRTPASLGAACLPQDLLDLFLGILDLFLELLQPVAQSLVLRRDRRRGGGRAGCDGARVQEVGRRPRSGVPDHSLGGPAQQAAQRRSAAEGLVLLEDEGHGAGDMGARHRRAAHLCLSTVGPVPGGLYVGAGRIDVQARPVGAEAGPAVALLRGSNGDGRRHVRGRVLASVRLAASAVISGGNDDRHAALHRRVDGGLDAVKDSLAAQARAEDGRLHAVCQDPVDRLDEPGEGAAAVVAEDLDGVEGCLLCNSVGGAADGPSAMRPVALLVEGAARVRGRADLAPGRQHLERGDGPTAEVSVGGADPRVGHVDVDALSGEGWRVVLVQTLTVVHAIDAPRRRVGLLEQSWVLVLLLSANLVDEPPRHDGLHDGRGWPSVRCQLLPDLLLGAGHHEGAEAALVGIALKVCRGAVRHVLRHLVDVFIGAAFGNDDQPLAGASLGHVGLVVDQDPGTLEVLHPCALRRQHRGLLLQGLLSLRLLLLADGRPGALA